MDRNVRGPNQAPSSSCGPAQPHGNQKQYTMIPDLRPRDRHAVVRACVMRKWEYRGSSDNDPVQHLNLVLADEEKNAIHAQIFPSDIERFDSSIQEGSVYIISRFRVSSVKNRYRPVRAPYMIEFTLYKKIVNENSPPATFPKYVYRLTTFDDLYTCIGDETYFLDVIGVITQVAQPEWRNLASQPNPVLARDIQLQDANGFEMKLTLWGRRASDFTIDSVYNSDTAQAIVTLFVGCIMKTYKGDHYLSGSYPCKWYFNPEIPEVQPFRTRFQGHRLQLKNIDDGVEEIADPPAAPVLEAKCLKKLNEMSPYDFPDDDCHCTVTVARLLPNKGWSYPACNFYSRACSPYGSGYTCFQCNSSSYKYKYKLPFVGTDGTAEAEMICFGNTAGRMIKKSVDYLMTQHKQTNTVPPVIASIVGDKFTFAMKLGDESYYSRTKTYIVTSIVHAYGKQRTISQATTRPGTPSIQQHHSLPMQQNYASPSRSNPDIVPLSCTEAQHTPPPTLCIAETPTKDLPSLNVHEQASRSAQKQLLFDDQTATQKEHEQPSKRLKLDHSGHNSETTSSDRTSPTKNPPAVKKLPPMKTNSQKSQGLQKLSDPAMFFLLFLVVLLLKPRWVSSESKM